MTGSVQAKAALLIRWIAISTNGDCVTFRNSSNAALFKTNCPQYLVQEYHFRGRLGPHQSAYSVSGPWTAPATNTFVWMWTAPYLRPGGQMVPTLFFKGSVTEFHYWTNKPVSEVSYLTIE